MSGSVGALAGRQGAVVIGTSHVISIREAWSPETDPPVAFYTFRRLQRDLAAFRETLAALHADLPDPTHVFLAFGGNHHNMLGLVRYDRPFAVGAEDVGRIPPTPDETDFIPRDVMAAVMGRDIATWEGMIAAVRARFAGARFVHVQSPPPVRDVPRLADPDSLTDAQKFIHAVLENKQVDPDLRLALYRIQMAEAARMARESGAGVIEAPAGALTSEGFLDGGFCANGDPTHGNRAYGRLVLDQIVACCGAAA